MEYPFIKVCVKKAFYPSLKGYVELADTVAIPIMHINAIEDCSDIKEEKRIKGVFIRLNTGIQYEVKESFDEIWKMLHNNE
jgi:hypothetical protein